MPRPLTRRRLLSHMGIGAGLLAMPAISRGRISTIVISVPRVTNRLANSQPITPPPTTIMLSGTLSRRRISLEVRIAGWSMS